jgi:hypothetical protein
MFALLRTRVNRIIAVHFIDYRIGKLANNEGRRSSRDFEQSTHESMHRLGFRFDELVVGCHRLEAHLLKRRLVGEKFLETSPVLIYFFIAKYHNFLAIELKYYNHATL